MISLLSGRDNTVLQSSLDTAGLLELANENIWLEVPDPHPRHVPYTHTDAEQLTHVESTYRPAVSDIEM